MRSIATTKGFRAARQHRLAGTGAMLILALALLTGAEAVPQTAPARPPQNLQDTGLYVDFESLRVDPKHLAFAPQYPLWTDGATKRRWISLPPGTAIDGSDPDAWNFPAGTRLWKEFSFNGRRIETRYLERQADGQWLYVRGFDSENLINSGYDIWRMRPDGSHAQNLTSQLPLNETIVGLTANDTWIIFTSDNAGVGDIWRMRPRT